MEQLIRTERYTPTPISATVISQKYYFKNGEFPDGYGKWIFTNKQGDELEVIGFYSSAVLIAQRHFKSIGSYYCYVSTESQTLKSPKGKPKAEWTIRKTNLAPKN